MGTDTPLSRRNRELSLSDVLKEYTRRGRTALAAGVDNSMPYPQQHRGEGKSRYRP